MLKLINAIFWGLVVAIWIVLLYQSIEREIQYQQLLQDVAEIKASL